MNSCAAVQVYTTFIDLHGCVLKQQTQHASEMKSSHLAVIPHVTDISCE